MKAHLTRITVISVVLALTAGCGGRKEKRRIIKAVNRHKVVAERDGHVKGVTIHEALDKDANSPFVAEIYDEDGNPIGKVRGNRIEGFGTIVRSYVWYDEPGWEEKEARLAAEDERREKSKADRWQQKRADVGLTGPEEQ